MKLTVWMVFILVGMTQSHAHPEDSTCRNAVCQYCNNWCSASQTKFLGPSGDEPVSQSRHVRRGRTGRPGIPGIDGLPGRKGEPGIVNLAEIEDIIERKVKWAIEQHDTTRRMNCRDVTLEPANSPNRMEGVFDIEIPDVGIKEFRCDSTTDGGNWIVFQRRIDGSVDFDRTWSEYADGFGNASGEYWLGLETIHQLTKNGSQMRIDMIKRDGTPYYATYSSFQVGPASDNYTLRVSGYFGNCTDNMENPDFIAAVLNNQQFSTKYVDNDKSSSDCASTYKGGWWFNDCQTGHLNGVYDDLENFRGIYWYEQERNEGMHMRFTEMKLRRNY